MEREVKERKKDRIEMPLFDRQVRFLSNSVKIMPDLNPVYSKSFRSVQSVQVTKAYFLTGIFAF